jgi:hypothetical protein
MPATIVDCPAEYTKWGAACLWITHAARGGRPAWVVDSARVRAAQPLGTASHGPTPERVVFGLGVPKAFTEAEANEAMDAMGVPRSTREALERHAKAPQWATSEDFQAWSASVGFVSDDDATKASPVFDVQAPEHFGYLTVAAMTRTGR